MQAVLACLRVVGFRQLVVAGLVPFRAHGRGRWKRQFEEAP